MMKSEFIKLEINTNIRFTEDEYLFSYKNHIFKYITGYKQKKTDSIVGLYSFHDGSGYFKNKDFIYKLMTEFISLVAFYTRQHMRPNQVQFPPINKNCGFTVEEYNDRKGMILMNQEREILSNYVISSIPNLPYLETEEQVGLVRLFRHAENTNNLYAKILFYWHVIVYPSNKDGDGESYINNLIDDKTGEFKTEDLKNSYFKWLVENKPLFSKEFQGLRENNVELSKSLGRKTSVYPKLKENLGKYIKNGLVANNF
ncbi:hypothetical protein ACFL0U_03570 [Pseudomonadota bacterium]